MPYRERGGRQIERHRRSEAQWHSEREREGERERMMWVPDVTIKDRHMNLSRTVECITHRTVCKRRFDSPLRSEGK